MQTLVGEGVRDAVAMVFSSKEVLEQSDGRRNKGREQDESFRGDMLFEVETKRQRYVLKFSSYSEAGAQDGWLCK